MPSSASSFVDVKMGRSELCVLLISCYFFYGGYFAFAKTDYPECFQFRWMGPLFTNDSKSSNCSSLKGVPCIDPLILTTPNTTELWLEHDEDKFCQMTPGNVCIKYTFVYNNAVVNTSSFCGKIIADKTTAITDECFTQNIEGYSVNVCACQTRLGAIPCNKSGRMESSLTLAMISLIIGVLRCNLF